MLKERAGAEVPTPEADAKRKLVGLTLDRVVTLRRPAWRCPGEAEDLEFHFDGSHFWRWRPGEPHTLAARLARPVEGWLHSNECTCAVSRTQGAVSV